VGVKVAIGSDNKVKVEAVREAFRLANLNAEKIPTGVESGVRLQPLSNEEVIICAINRARRAMPLPDFDLRMVV